MPRKTPTYTLHGPRSPETHRVSTGHTRSLRHHGVTLVMLVTVALLGSGATAAAQSHAQSHGATAAATASLRESVTDARDSTISTLLTGPLGSRSPTGSASLTGMTVRVTISGDRPGVARTWHVHRGTCGRNDGVVDAAGGYQPLAIDARGAGSATATLEAPLAGDAGYVLDVHDTSPSATLDAIACGVLTRPPAIGDYRDWARSGMAAVNGMAAMPGMANMPGMATAAHGNASWPSPMPSSAVPSDSLASLLMSAFDRMVADPVIRERVATDPVLRGLVARLAASRGGASGAMPHDGANMPGMPGMAMPSRPASKEATPPRPSTGRSTTKASTAKRARKPASKPAPKSAPTPAKPKMPPDMKMPGMDHGGMGDMQGMKKP